MLLLERDGEYKELIAMALVDRERFFSIANTAISLCKDLITLITFAHAGILIAEISQVTISICISNTFILIHERMYRL